MIQLMPVTIDELIVTELLPVDDMGDPVFRRVEGVTDDRP